MKTRFPLTSYAQMVDLMQIVSIISKTFKKINIQLVCHKIEINADHSIFLGGNGLSTGSLTHVLPLFFRDFRIIQQAGDTAAYGIQVFRPGNDKLLHYGRRTGAQHDNPVGNGKRFINIVRDKQHGLPFFTPAFQQQGTTTDQAMTVVIVKIDVAFMGIKATLIATNRYYTLV